MAMNKIEQGLGSVRARIQAAEKRFGRPAGSVRLLAVSKTKPADAVAEAYRLGQRDFGENHLQDAQTKLDALSSLDITWHFIGPVQSNKTRPIAEGFAWVHSLDRMKIATRLNDQRPAQLPPLDVCIQVNISGEETKSGIDPAGLAELAEGIRQLSRLKLRGLMTIPKPADDFEDQRAPFRKLRLLLEDLNRSDFGLDVLSMGMTDDLEAAIAEGATLVRVGTAIFGARS